MKLQSLRFKKEYELQTYKMDENTLVIFHTCLEIIYWSLPDEERPVFQIEPFNVMCFPGMPALFAVKGTMKQKDFYGEFIGEMFYREWQITNGINKNNALTICRNRAFDKAFIRFMQFDTPFKLYSSEEIMISRELEMPANETAGYDTTSNASVPGMGRYPQPVPQKLPVYDLQDAIKAVNPTAQNVGPNTAGSANADCVPDIVQNSPSSYEAGLNTDPAENGQIKLDLQFDRPSCTAPCPVPPIQDTPTLQKEKSCAEDGENSMDIPDSIEIQDGLFGTTASPDDVCEENAKQGTLNPNVSRVTLDFAGGGKIKVWTDVGLYYYDQHEKKWSGDPNLQEIDLSKLYESASKLVNIPLDKFCGPVLP